MLHVICTGVLSAGVVFRNSSVPPGQVSGECSMLSVCWEDPYVVFTWHICADPSEEGSFFVPGVFSGLPYLCARAVDACFLSSYC